MSEQQINVANQETLDLVNTTVNNIYSKIAELDIIKSTVNTINSNLTTVDTVVDNIKAKTDLIGATSDTGGSATAGTVMGKLNKIISSSGTDYGSDINTIKTNTATNNTASSTGTLSQKMSYLINNANAVHGSQTYSTAGTYTWTAPEGVNMVIVNLVGGGGGGGGGSAGIRASGYNGYETVGYIRGGGSGGGGGAGACTIGHHKVTPGTGYTVVVGAGGSGGTKGSGYSTTSTVVNFGYGDVSSSLWTANSGGAGGNGGYSRFGDIRANGGNGGKGGTGGAVSQYDTNASKASTAGAAGSAIGIGRDYLYGHLGSWGGIAGTAGAAGSNATYYYSKNYVAQSGGASKAGGQGYLAVGDGGASGAGGTGPTGTTSPTTNDGTAGSTGGAGKVVIWW